MIVLSWLIKDNRLKDNQNQSFKSQVTLSAYGFITIVIFNVLDYTFLQIFKYLRRLIYFKNQKKDIKQKTMSEPMLYNHGR